MSLILCGLACVGKSTVGEAVAEHLALPFYDTDRMIEAVCKKTVREVWHALGEQAFRDLETLVVFSLKKEPCVIAIGGGTPLKKENRAYLKQLGRAIHLKVPLSLLWARIERRGFPAYLNEENPKEHFEQHAKKLLPVFDAFCDDTFETEGKSVDEIGFSLQTYFKKEVMRG